MQPSTVVSHDLSREATPSAFSASLPVVRQSAWDSLVAFARDGGFGADRLAPAFGTDIDSVVLANLASDFAGGDFSDLPSVALLPDTEMNGAIGAYAAELDTVFLAQDWLAGASLEQTTAVLLEEFGHGLDARLNEEDSPGDEGAIFSSIVRDVELGGSEILTLQGEDDSILIRVEDLLVPAEAAIYTVGGVDYDITIVTGAFATESIGDQIKDTPWWGNSTLSDSIADAVKETLNTSSERVNLHIQQAVWGASQAS